MKKKILTLAAVVTLPFILLVMYLLASMASYSNTYDEIVSNMTVANNYNLNFKEEMDESLYKLVVGYVTLDTIETDKSLKNPYTLIDELRSEFTRLTAIPQNLRASCGWRAFFAISIPWKKGWTILWTAFLPVADIMRILRSWTTIFTF